jgi:hypothetical protein
MRVPTADDQFACLTTSDVGVGDADGADECGTWREVVTTMRQAPAARKSGLASGERSLVLQRILRHLRLPTDVPELRPARPPPCTVDPIEDQSQEAPEFDAAW